MNPMIIRVFGVRETQNWWCREDKLIFSHLKIRGRTVCHSARLVGTPSIIVAVSAAVSIISPDGRLDTPDPPHQAVSVQRCALTQVI